jgi:hypothetical protein
MTEISRDVQHTSRVGTGSSRLLSHFTETFIKEKKNWEAATSNNPVLLPMNEDADNLAKCHLSERFRLVPCACLGCSSGDVSSRGGRPSRGNSESEEYDTARVSMISTKRTVAITKE